MESGQQPVWRSLGLLGRSADGPGLGPGNCEKRLLWAASLLCVLLDLQLPEPKELRSECYLHLGDYNKAIMDLKPTIKLQNDNRAAFLKLSKLYYNLGEHEESLTQVWECLKLDQDDKDYFSHYKQVKKLTKQLESAEEHIKAQRYADAIEKYKATMKTEPNVEICTTKAKGWIYHCLSKSKRTAEAIDLCSEAHQLDPRNIFILRDRAESFILNEEFEKAIEDYQEAKEFDAENEELKDGLERAQKLLKQSKKRNYYKILGIQRNANKQEIKAYRKLAQQWHPDNFQSEDEKKEAEKKLIDIAAAKEVLTDPEMRQKFDSGENPLDPENQQGGSGHQHQWVSKFNPFGSGNFHFKFHFN